MTRPPSRQARRLLADAVRAKGPAWRNAADSVEAGTYANAWTEAALVAIETGIRTGPDDRDEEG